MLPGSVCCNFLCSRSVRVLTQLEWPRMSQLIPERWAGISSVFPTLCWLCAESLCGPRVKVLLWLLLIYQNKFQVQITLHHAEKIIAIERNFAGGNIDEYSLSAYFCHRERWTAPLYWCLAKDGGAFEALCPCCCCWQQQITIDLLVVRPSKGLEAAADGSLRHGLQRAALHRSCRCPIAGISVLF